MTDDIVTAPESETAASVSTIGSEGLHEFIRYFVASGVALFIDLAALWFLVEILSLHYLVSGALAFLAGLTAVYILSIQWVFAKRTVKDAKTEFALFALIGIVGLGLNHAILWSLTGFFGVYYLLSKFASVFVVFTWNFGARKWVLFRNK